MHQSQLFSMSPQDDADFPPSIDFAFPEEEADALARLELFNKHLFRPNTYLHKWWARRSGTTFRRILKALAHPAQRGFYTPGGLEGMVILDPMMGGGTTLHEALRMGAKVIGCDIDPIPVLQAKVSLSLSNPAERTRIFSQFLSRLRQDLARFYRSACPHCKGDAEVLYFLYGAQWKTDSEYILSVNDAVLREEKEGSGRRSVFISDFYPDGIASVKERNYRLVEKSTLRKMKNAKLVLNVPYSERFTPLVVVGECAKCGQFHKKPDLQDHAVISAARDELMKNLKELPENDHITDGPKSGDLLRREIKRYCELFSPRQLLYMMRAKAMLSQIPESERSWLGLLISASLEFNSMLCGYKGGSHWRAGAIRHVFSHHAYSFPHTALENNPIFSGRSSGTLQLLFERRIRAAGEWARCPIERAPIKGGWASVTIDGEIDGGREYSSFADLTRGTSGFIAEQRDSATLNIPDGAVDFIVTDPPYFDSVQYGDLSGFFRCWLEWLLPNEANWHYHVESAAVAGNRTSDDFRRGLENIWRECSRVLARPHGRLIFTYHHWRADAWAALTLALQAAGFRLLNHYTVQSESSKSVHIRNLNALMHDSILVFIPDATGEMKKWNPPNQMPNESRDFCRACAEMLGHLLESDKSESEINAIWCTALGNRK